MTARALALYVGSASSGRGAPPPGLTGADPTGAWVERLGRSLPDDQRRGVVVVASSFEAPRWTVTTSGDRGLARRVLERLVGGGLPAATDEARAPAIEVGAAVACLAAGRPLPVVELSLHATLDAEQHLAVGRLLEPLRDEGIIILGLGGLTRAVPGDAPRTRAGREVTGTFDAWVVDLLTRSGPYARSRGLGRFRDHPGAHRADPRGEHVLPLVVVAGAATSDRSPANVGELAHTTSPAAGDGARGGALGLVFRR